MPDSPTTPGERRPPVTGPPDPLGAARTRGAPALLLTVLGEFVLPAGGRAWTSSLVRALDVLAVNEKNARQAIARVADQGVMAPSRQGRRVRWELTDPGRGLLENGAARIYDFGRSDATWSGEWLIAHCAVPEARRAQRHRLRRRLSFEGFGELSASVFVSPRVDREGVLREILEQLGVADEGFVWRGRTGSPERDADLVARAWNLATLGSSYERFCSRFGARRPSRPEALFRATVELVDEWRQFPFEDPELPEALLPEGWAGHAAREVFRDRRGRWSPDAQRWFAAAEGG